MEFFYDKEDDPNPVCESGVFCHGELLKTLQLSGIYKDSKTFVDKKLKHSPGKVIKSFNELVKSGVELTTEDLQKFVLENFDDEGKEFESLPPVDWTPNPEFLSTLKSGKLRGLGRRINTLWKTLNRRIIEDVSLNQTLFSIIYVPNPIVVPGGRFREFYYWDTFWIVRSLLHCDMTVTVRGMIENFFTLLEKYGCIPNGGRIYYIKRSQPPVLSLMVEDYFKKSGDLEFLRRAINPLLIEIKFWEENRAVKVKYSGEEFTLFRYGTGGTGPRPESFQEDYNLADQMGEEMAKHMYYELKAGAESGWDYSSRWFINKQGEASKDIMDINTSAILPVDLNSIMFMNYKNLANFYERIGDQEKVKQYRLKAAKMKLAIYTVFYDVGEKMWFDYDMLNNKRRKYFYLSNVFPLWAECYPEEVAKEDAGKNTIDYLKRVGALDYSGGVPTSLIDSGQQWDFPNAWPPLQHVLVLGLLNSGQEKWAQNLARLYTEATMFSCPEDAEACKIYEKYNVVDTGSAGGGGEYEVQEGFGWTNGVIIDFLMIFGDKILEDHSADINDIAVKKDEVISVFDTSAGKSHPIRSKAWKKLRSIHKMGKAFLVKE